MEFNIKDCNKAYKEGYKAGYDDGYESGYVLGFKNGLINSINTLEQDLKFLDEDDSEESK